MTARRPRAYRFATASQWKRCINHRFDVGRKGGLTPAPRLGSYATRFSDDVPVPGVAIDPHGEPFRPAEASVPLGCSPRIVADRDWLWVFAPKGTSVSRYERDTLQSDLTIDVGFEVRDITSDGREGIWVLAVDAAGASGANEAYSLLHFDCEGRSRERHTVPCELSHPIQLGCVNRGRQLVLLAGDQKRLLFLDAASGATERVRSIGLLAPCWSATQLTTDTRNRIALWGPQTLRKDPKWVLFVLDSSGDTLDGPIGDVFSGARAGQPSPRSLETVRLAVHRDSVWFATDHGLWRLEPGESNGARESDSTLLTPPLFSPDSDSDRGWLRAEVTVDLPSGASLEAQFATTDDKSVASQAARVGDDGTLTAEQKQEAIWALLDPPESRRFVVADTGGAGLPIAIPLLEPLHRWLWLRITLVTPPGTTPKPIQELRVLYPNLSIGAFLPAAFRGQANDPTGAMRSLVGVLESTSQRVDERIRRIGSYIDPQTAPPEWFDYLGRWLDLPWDDGLPEAAKQRLLQRAGTILDARGTRAGLRALLACLLGTDAVVQIADLTVDHAPIRIGGHGRAGGTLPSLLAGASTRAAKLGGKAVLGRARLSRLRGDADPLTPIVPTLRIRITARREIQRGLEDLLPRILAQYVPAGIEIAARWRIAEAVGSDFIGPDGIVLDAKGPGTLGHDSTIGRTVLGGRQRGRLDESGLEIGFRLR